MEIEAILNNKPLYEDYDDNVEDVSTPNHLVYGRRLENINEKNSCSIKVEVSIELGKREEISSVGNICLECVAKRIFDVTS